MLIVRWLSYLAVTTSILLASAPRAAAEPGAPVGDEPGAVAAPRQPALQTAPERNAYPSPAPAAPAPPPPYLPPSGSAANLTDPPSTGTGLVISGSILLGLGIVNLATSPICRTSAVRDDLQDTCLYLSLGVGGGLVAAGTPLLVVGLSKRRRFREWQRRHPVVAALSRVRIAADPGRPTFAWGTEF